MTALATLASVLAALPAGMTLWNLALFRPPPVTIPPGLAVSVVIPARDEAANIGACVDAVRASTGCVIEIVVVDDQSTDATPALVAERMAVDPRVRVVSPPALPVGWSGKMHACLAGGRAATHPVLLFIDADVRLEPDAVARLAAGLRAEAAGLASAFPRELALSLGEMLLVPLIHVLLLGYLPLAQMRRSRQPGLGAGCGQIMVADAAAYHAMGGHGAISRSWHDGVTLPRAFREAGHMTALFDGTGLASCRMYEGWTASWAGFSKNAREGLAKPKALPIWTILLGGGFVLAPVLAVLSPSPVLVACVALLAVARCAVAWRFRQSWVTVVLTPVAMMVNLALQWCALLRGGRAPVRWRGRVQAT